FHDWKHVCVGDLANEILGRVPMTVRTVVALGARCVIWSTGATFIDHVCEADMMMRCALECSSKYNLPEESLIRMSLFDRESTNTRSSMAVAARIVKQKYPSESVMVHLVTSANHAPRVLRDAIIEFSSDRNVLLSGVPAYTSYGRKGPADIEILELP